MSSSGTPSTSGRGASASGGGALSAAQELFQHMPAMPGMPGMSGAQPSTTTLALTVAGAAVAGAVVWHLTRETYYTYVPPQVRDRGSSLGRLERVQGEPDSQQLPTCRRRPASTVSSPNC